MSNFKIQSLTMKKYIKTIGILALCIFGISSCKKAGTDGDATLVVFAKHHGVIITNKNTYPDSVYVKFNAKDAPSDPTHDYDAVFVGEVGEDHIHCTNLHAGTYYLFVTGMDSTITQRVYGGASVKIKYKERKGEIDTDIAVTE
ncbi:hypothetical protein BH09BAC5_BH09BAC5_00670 [soil metagenome]